MKKWYRLLAAGLSLALLAGCSGGTASLGQGSGAGPLQLSAGKPAGEVPGTPVRSEKADGALGRFGASLLAGVRTEGENTLVSPLSVLLCLSMCANGAEGETLQAFLDTLGGGVTLEELNANCATLVEEYLGLEGSTQCNIAGSLWLDDQLRANEDFLTRCAASYRAGVYQTDLSAPPVVEQVNSWVREQTREMIDGILSEPLSADAALVLVNAIYLKNAWQREFDPLDTWEEGQFHPASGEVQTCPFLCNGTRTERYFATELGRGVVLPYDDGRLGFLALLPEGDLSACLEQWDGETLPGLLSAAEDTKLLLRLPKFEAEWGGSLNDILTTLGLGIAFEPGGADFSGIGEADGGPLYLSDVIHKTRIEVNEKGTEAAAVTAAIMECCAAPVFEEPEELILDRPFLYGIIDLERGVPLFLGTFETA